MRLGNLRQSLLLDLASPCGTGLLATRLGLRCPIHLPEGLLMDWPNMRPGPLAMTTFGLASRSPVDWLHHKVCLWRSWR